MVNSDLRSLSLGTDPIPAAVPASSGPAPLSLQSRGPGIATSGTGCFHVSFASGYFSRPQPPHKAMLIGHIGAFRVTEVGQRRDSSLSCMPAFKPVVVLETTLGPSQEGVRRPTRRGLGHAGQVGARGAGTDRRIQGAGVAVPQYHRGHLGGGYRTNCIG